MINCSKGASAVAVLKSAGCQFEGQIYLIPFSERSSPGEKTAVNSVDSNDVALFLFASVTYLLTSLINSSSIKGSDFVEVIFTEVCVTNDVPYFCIIFFQGSLKVKVSSSIWILVSKCFYE